MHRRHLRPPPMTLTKTNKEVAEVVVAVALVLCDSTRNSEENHEVGAVRQAVVVVPEVVAAVEAVARAAALPGVARRPVALRIAPAT